MRSFSELTLGPRDRAGYPLGGQGFTVFNAQWYAGHHTPGYSLLWLWLGLALLMLVIGWFALVLVATMPSHRLRKIPGVEELHGRLLRHRFAKTVSTITRRHRDGELSPEQAAVVAAIETTRDHIFVTGRAGTGKSTLLEHLSWHSSHTLAICAPTGVAALNVGGQTIHSLFRLPIGVIADHELDQPPELRKLLSAIDTLVVDEVSMVSADLMDAIADDNPGAPASVARARDAASFLRFLAERMPQLADEWRATRQGADGGSTTVEG